MFASNQKLTATDMLQISKDISTGTFSITDEYLNKAKNGVENNTFTLTLFSLNSTAWHLLGDLLSQCPNLTTFKVDKEPQAGRYYYRLRADNVIELGKACFSRSKLLDTLDLLTDLSGSGSNFKGLASTFVSCYNLRTLKLPACGLWQIPQNIFEEFVQELGKSETITCIDIRPTQQELDEWESNFWQSLIGRDMHAAEQEYYDDMLRNYNGWDSEWNLKLMSELTKVQTPIPKTIYLEKQGNKLKYVAFSTNNQIVQGELDIIIEGNLTWEELNIKKTEIFAITSTRGHTSWSRAKELDKLCQINSAIRNKKILEMFDEERIKFRQLQQSNASTTPNSNDAFPLDQTYLPWEPVLKILQFTHAAPPFPKDITPITEEQINAVVFRAQ